jgi:Flp pilus assembly protein TadG
MSADDDGSAVVEFVLVSSMLVLLILGVLQLGLALHVRNALIAAAGEGARFAALADTGLDEGAARTRELVAASLGVDYEVDVGVVSTTVGGVPAIAVTVRAPLPVAGLLGPAGMLEVVGRAPIESLD